MALALFVRDEERAQTVLHSLYTKREPWMDGYDVRDVTGTNGAAPGWLSDDSGRLSAPAAPPPAVPFSISRRQFFQQLAVNGDITQDEALAAVTVAALPKKLEDAIAALPQAQRFPTRMLISGASQFERANPLVAVLGAALNKSDADLDAIWTAAGKL